MAQWWTIHADSCALEGMHCASGGAGPLAAKRVRDLRVATAAVVCVGSKSAWKLPVASVLASIVVQAAFS